LMGLIFGIAITYSLKIFFPSLPKIVFLIVFGFTAIFSYIVFKFFEDLLNLLVGILSFPLTAIMLGIICFIQGASLIFNKNFIEAFIKLILT
ncbi:MAG: hypothetical protein QW589_06585, partial [Candidatus Bathyarchaeia archaeon]